MRNKPALASTILWLAIAACAPGDENRKAPAPAVKSPAEIARMRASNDTARFLAGLPQRKDSPLRALTENRAYGEHVRFMDRFWARVRKEHIAPVNGWKTQWLNTEHAANTAVYPLSGADFVNLHNFYPGARRYIMFALEQPGRIPDFRRATPSRTARDLRSLRRVIHTIASLNYFYSSHMRRELRDNRLTGTAPILLVFAARLGFQIESWEHVGLDSAGRLFVLKTSGPGALRAPVTRGIRLRLKDARGSRDLLYFNIRVTRGTLGPGTPGGVYFRSFGRINALFKSAVYLMHYERYAAARDFILERSDVIVQDDSGIPYRFFANERWNVQLYGSYHTHYMNINGIGRPPVQNDLRARYRAGTDIQPSVFRFGYGGIRGAQHSTLMLLKRRKNP